MYVVATGLWPVDLCCLSHQGRTAHRAVATAATVLFKPLWRIAKSLNWIMFGFARAPVAQLDRALASGAKGCGFDPRRAHGFVGQALRLPGAERQPKRLPYKQSLEFSPPAKIP